MWRLSQRYFYPSAAPFLSIPVDYLLRVLCNYVTSYQIIDRALISSHRTVVGYLLHASLLFRVPEFPAHRLF